MPITTATAAAIAAGTQLVGAGASFAQAAKNNRLRRESEEAAKKYLDQAIKSYKTNYAEDIQVPLEGYERAAEMNTQAAGQALEAMRESGQRAVLGGVAGLQQQAQAGSEELRMAMQGDLYKRNLMIAEEEANIRDRLANIDLNQATGAQQAAADARVRGAQSVESGLANIAGAGNTIFEASELYRKYSDDTTSGLGGLFPGKPKAGTSSVGSTTNLKSGANPAAGIIPKPKFKLPTGF
jgi:hypothetical protein